MRYRDEGRSPGLTDLFRRWERLALVPPVCGGVRRGAAGPDYYAATPAIAIDATGQMALAYTFWTLRSGTKGLYVRTSNDGGDSSVPQVASGSPGDLRLAWQDDRTDEFNTVREGHGWRRELGAGGAHDNIFRKDTFNIPGSAPLPDRQRRERLLPEHLRGLSIPAVQRG